ncbi:hypothetical protein LOC67_21195 [Stieleria sp. JC731]|uniref:hypothetical protein n=1 Tax=Pirellulaceae TaxID=2691357 RepID=UPI001E4054C0|nr:hypothetical protein [Stieleria sp. JC731]MCC9603073.1 hypothetical protein [Stieleria sp. JC731]
MSRRLLSLAALAAVIGSTTATVNQSVFAQNQSVLAETYGRGVHAYYAGDYADAFDQLTAAIDGGSRDPRVYYFRGIVAHLQGRPEQAEGDWKEGAKLEAAYGGGYYVGRSLSRFQGSARLKLEQIRQTARLEAMANASNRSDIRMKELNAAAPSPVQQAPATRPAPAPAAPVNPTVDNPFADDVAQGAPKVEDNDMLKDVVGDPFANEEPVGGAAAAGGAAPAASDDPFGGSAPAGGDPFGGGDAGGSPFGGGAGDSDPFGGDPFGN